MNQHLQGTPFAAAATACGRIVGAIPTYGRYGVSTATSRRSPWGQAQRTSALFPLTNRTARPAAAILPQLVMLTPISP